MPDRADNSRRALRRPARRHAGSWCPAALLLSVLAGCATTSGPPAPAEAPSPILRELAERLPGEYVSVRGQDSPAQILRVEVRNGGGEDRLGLLMVQQEAGANRDRRFGLQLEPAAIANRLEGRFALLEGGDQVRRSCPMDFHLTGQALVGETDPASCRFGEGAETVGLLKEIAFDGRQISIGDRLVDPETGESLGEDLVIRFLPAPEYSGWLGVREGDEWRVASDFTLPMGEGIEPLDAAEMSLGVSLELAYYQIDARGEGTDATLLRLSVTELSTGRIIAESWAEPGSRRIGLALPDFQVGLERND